MASAAQFIRSLSKIKNNNKPFEQTNPEIRRAREIKVAAYASMARAAGKNMAWSRAILRKIRIQKRLKMKTKKTKKKIIKNRRRRCDRINGQEGYSKLRRIVPGGEEMEICMLIDETGDYIRCLAMQVRLMQCLVDGFSS